MTSIKNIFLLLRPEQWYKNLVVFLAIIFSGNLLNTGLLLKALLAFVSLCFVSSANYIINDFADLRTDRKNNEKRLRQIASGRISVVHALFMTIILFAAALLIAYSQSIMFFYAVLFLFFFTQLYTFFLKKEVFADILAIGINFIARAVSGAFVINVWVSPWLILGPFFLSVFLSTGKRYSELVQLGKRADHQRLVFKAYTLNMMNSMLIISTACLIISYSLYSFLSEHEYLIFSMPFALYIILRYFHMVYSGSDTARMPQKVFKDARILVGLALWLISVLLIVYVL